MSHVHDYTQQYESIHALLSAEEGAQPVSEYGEWEERAARRAALTEHLSQLGQLVSSLRRRADALPTLPLREHLHRAQALLALPNLAFLEVDTDGLYADADILRIVLVDSTGTALYDQVFQPRRPLSPTIAHLTGLAPEMLAQAPTLAEAWHGVSALIGRYILSFNLEFDQGKLAENTGRYGLSPLPLVGDCLMLRAQEYYGTSSYPKLADLCRRLGHPMPEHPYQDALDRARGQIRLLRAMAQGITDAPVARRMAEEIQSRDGGDPFLPDFPDETD